MTAPLPPLPDIFYERFAPACGLNVCEEARTYAKLAVREALERIVDDCDDRDYVSARYIRAIIEEYK